MKLPLRFVVFSTCTWAPVAVVPAADSATPVRPLPPAPAAAADTGDAEEAQPHFELAKKLIASGQQEAALKELVWCWDEGKKDPEFSRTRSSVVGRELGRLAREYPPARDVMIARRNQARERALANKGGSFVIQDLIQLNRELKEDEDTLGVFDQIPADDRRRVTISIYLFDLLLEKKRYADALLFNQPETHLAEIERARAQLKKGGEQSAMMLRYTLARLAKRVEALAGTQQLDDARRLGQQLLTLDASDATRSLLRDHAARAGQPGLFAKPE